MEKIKLNIQRFAGTCQLNASETNVDIENNSSKINLTTTVQTTGNTYNNESNSAYYQIKIKRKTDNVQIYDSGKIYFKISKNSNKSFSLTTPAIEHDSDGSYSELAISLYVRFTSTTNSSDSMNLTLTNIPRASTITSSTASATLGSTINFTITRASNDFTHDLTYTANGTTGTIATNVSTSYSWETPENLLPNALSDDVVITCTTKYNGETIGTSNVTVNLSTPSYTPTLSIGLYDENSTTRAWNTYVDGKSTMKVTLTGASSYSGTISKYELKMASGDSYTDCGTNNTIYPQINSNGVVYAKITDSRGKTKEANTSYTYASYNVPQIEVFEIQRCDIDGTLNNNGDYCHIKAKASISSCNNNNKTNTTYKVYYKLKGSSTYTNSVTIGSNSDSINLEGILNTDGVYVSGHGNELQLSSSNEYDLKLVIQDTFDSVSLTQSLDTGFDLLNFNASGLAMAIGKVSGASANQKLLEIDLPTVFSDSVTTGDITINDLTVDDITASGDLNVTGDIGCNDISSSSITSTSISSSNISGEHISIGNTELFTPELIQAKTNFGASFSDTSEVQILLLEDIKIGNKFSITNDKGILIGSGISKIKVNAQVWFSTGFNAGDSYRMSIYKNNTKVAEAGGRVQSANAYETANISGKIIEVQENDVIYLYCKNATGGRGSISNDEELTFITIEKVS